MQYLPKGKAVLTGSPIREELLAGDAAAARRLCGFENNLPVLFIIGGSSGSVVINQAVREALPRLLEKFQVVHMCGKGNLEPDLAQTKGYRQFEYIGKELRDIFALSDLVVSRAGANSICELLALHKPNLLIPLSAAASRGDQILNAQSFEKQGFSMVLKEEDMTADSLVSSVEQLYADRKTYQKAMTDSNQLDSIQMIVDLIQQVSK
jgi:UDP-N-acetylglucosamine--N-acetylmuramyl-(pentapeptide) pyrophosphoryl-undecaprenol N-acetylglucosamine transferase